MAAEKELSGKVALVTGATRRRGVGRALGRGEVIMINGGEVRRAAN